MPPTIIAGTLQTDPRSGGIKKSSGVKVLPEVAAVWEQVRDNNNPDVDWVMCGYVENSKTDITVLYKGNGGLAACAAKLPEAEPVWGGIRLSTGRFTGFYYVGESCSAMKKGRASMHKNGVLNVLQGRDGEINIQPGMTE
jgi:Cofilin/tropomyosin-type actin-binding protein